MIEGEDLYFDEQSHLQIYKCKSLEELKSIQPKWACGTNIDKLYNKCLLPENNEFTIFLTDTCALVNKGELLGLDSHVLFTEDALNDKRVAEILYRWEHFYFIDPPSICVNDSKRIGFYDGRHRSKVSYLLGFTQIPVAVLNSDVSEISQMINVIPTSPFSDLL